MWQLPVRTIDGWQLQHVVPKSPGKLAAVAIPQFDVHQVDATLDMPKKRRLVHHLAWIWLVYLR